MLNTAAVNTYWKEETKNNVVFSMFVAWSLSVFPGSYGGGGVYLLHLSRGFNKRFLITAHHVCALTQ